MAYNIIRPRRGIKSLWQQYKSRIYKQGEMLVESPETGVGTGPVDVKFGDGVTDYEHLPYAVLAPIDGVKKGEQRPITSNGVFYAGFMKQTDVVDNLTSTATNLPVSANAARLLSEQLGGYTLKVIPESEYTSLATKDANTLYFTY